MKVIKDNEELKSYIKNYKIVFNCSIKCDFNINVEASIKALDIKALDIEAWDIEARDIEARDIKALDIEALDIKALDIKALDIEAWDIEAGDIEARDIEALDIKALDIKALDIKAWDIEAWDIEAGDISFWSYCISRLSLKCKSIIGRRENSIFKCLDSEIEYIKDVVVDELTMEDLEKELGRKIKIIK